MPNSRPPPASGFTLEKGTAVTAAQRISLMQAGCFEKAWSAASINDLLVRSGTSALIAKKSFEDAGFALVSQIVDQAEILSIGVSPDYRRLGAASFLLNEIILRLENSGVKKLFLYVSRSSQPAISLYAIFGFRRGGIRKNYYRSLTGQIEDALQYQLLIE